MTNFVSGKTIAIRYSELLIDTVIVTSTYPLKLSMRNSFNALNCEILEIWLLSAIKCSIESKPLMPSKLFKLHLLTFRYLIFSSQPRSRRFVSELPSKFRAVRFGKYICSWLNPYILDDTLIWTWCTFSKSAEFVAFRCRKEIWME